MKIIVCLGNPGSKYENTRHNIGFMVADRMADDSGLKWQAGVNSHFIRLGEMLIVKPMTYMNNSGEIFAHLPEFPEPESVLVVVDEVNLSLGRMRFRGSGSDGGHNGLKSIEWSLESRKYHRLRIGVGADEPVTGEELIDFVLGDFYEDERELLTKVIGVAAESISVWEREGVITAQDRYNGLDLHEAKSSGS